MEPLLVVRSITCFAAALAYVSARTSDKDAEILKSVTRVNQLKDQILGLNRIERVLLVGTSLNVVGEASKDDDGTVRIQRPLEGPFYVSRRTIDEHIANFVDSARWCKKTFVVLATIGACLLAAYSITILEGAVSLKCEKDSQVAQ